MPSLRRLPALRRPRVVTCHADRRPHILSPFPFVSSGCSRLLALVERRVLSSSRRPAEGGRMNSSLNPIVFALRHPITMMAAVAALAVGSVLAVQRMAFDVFPTLDLPVIYIAQPHTGLDPAQMESQITAYYEGYSIYIGGIEHVESKNIQGLSITKLFFHPGTNMGQ